MRPLRSPRVTVSGSFHRALREVQEAVQELRDLGCQVLSPRDPRPAIEVQGFLYLASDDVRNIRAVEDAHLRAIRASDFVWMVCPSGYAGTSTCMEIGFAWAMGIPIYAVQLPLDHDIVTRVTVVPNIPAAIAQARHVPFAPHATP